MDTMHLFAGGGGGLYADLILGHNPAVAVERDTKRCQILRQQAAAGWFPNLLVLEQSVELFDSSEYAGRMGCIHAGFPCQPHSLAGKRAGANDERNHWPDTGRIIGEVRPRFVFLENVAGIISNGYAAVVVADLAALGYDARWGVISAANAGAPHDRERWWCLAEHSDAKRERLEGIEQARPAPPPTDRPGYGCVTGWWKTEPGVGRVAHGVADRKHRIETLGLGQVPLQAALAWHTLGGP